MNEGDNNMLFKVGDTVRIKQIAGELSNNDNHFSNFIGEVHTIQEVKPDRTYPYSLAIPGTDGFSNSWWCDQELEIWQESAINNNKKETIMSVVNNLRDKKLTPEQVLRRKYGLEDNTGAMTNTGGQTLLEILWEENIDKVDAATKEYDDKLKSEVDENE
jgi:hypothetical protein